GVLAQRLEVAQAPAAMAAVQIEVCRHRIADLEAAHAGARLDDLAGDLVADDAGKLHLPAAGLDVLDGEARAAGDNARHRFAGACDRIGPLLQLERHVRTAQHHRLHAVSSTRRAIGTIPAGLGKPVVAARGLRDNRRKATQPSEDSPWTPRPSKPGP